MGRPRSTGVSHNKRSFTYLSTQKDNDRSSSGQTSIATFFQRPVVDTPEDSQHESVNTGRHDGINDDHPNETETATNADNEFTETNGMEIQTEGDNRYDGRMVDRDSKKKWEIHYDFLYFSASKNGWFCKICSECGEGMHWRTAAVDPKEHPGRTFENHSNSKGHKTAVSKRTEIKRMLGRKGSVYKQTLEGSGAKYRTTRARNRRVLKKFMKTTYFLSRKKWAVRENFSDVVSFLAELGDDDIVSHLRESSSRATYTSTSTVDEFLKCLSDFLDNDMITKINSAGEFSVLADETTDNADRAELSIFIRFVDSDSHDIREEFLGLVQVVGKKGAEPLCEKITSVLQQKGVDIRLMRFNGLDGTNSMSGEIGGLQRKLRHLSPHTKYVNCRNHRLALVFVHLQKSFKLLQAVDSLLLAVWKKMKYSTVKSAVFGHAQELEGQKPLKLLKAAPTRWLSHGEASLRLISRYTSLLNALDAIIEETADPEIIGIRNQLLQPNTILFLLLLADVLVHINRFSKFLQKKNLVYADVPHKLDQLKQALHELEGQDGPNTIKYSSDLLSDSQERLSLARRSRNQGFFPPTNRENELEQQKTTFRNKEKIPYLKALNKELNQAMEMNDDVFMAFDVFNVKQTESSHHEQIEKTQQLLNFYGEACSSTLNENTVRAEAVVSKSDLNEQTIAFFFEDYRASLTKAEELRNQEIKILTMQGKLKASEIDGYKDNHPISPSQIYKDMIPDREQYPAMMKLFKLSLLIPPSTANVERGFSILNLLHTKSRNRLSSTNIDRLMRLILVGPPNLQDDQWEQLADNFADLKERRLDI